MPILKKYCCCMTLRTGGVMIGISGIIYMLVLLVLLLTSNVRLNPVFIPDESGLLTKISVAVEMIIVVFVSILLIIGASKRKKWFLIPWLVVSVVTIAGLFIAHIYTITLMFNEENIWGGIVMIIYCIMVIGLAIYYWLVVLSLYQELAATERRT